VTYDAKDPDPKYPPITPIRPPKGAPSVPIVLIDDTGSWATRCAAAHVKAYCNYAAQCADLEGMAIAR
jgi:hypothetical protein